MCLHMLFATIYNETWKYSYDLYKPAKPSLAFFTTCSLFPHRASNIIWATNSSHKFNLGVSQLQANFWQNSVWLTRPGDAINFGVKLIALPGFGLFPLRSLYIYSIILLIWYHTSNLAITLLMAIWIMSSPTCVKNSSVVQSRHVKVLTLKCMLGRRSLALLKQGLRKCEVYRLEIFFLLCNNIFMI